MYLRSLQSNAGGSVSDCFAYLKKKKKKKTTINLSVLFHVKWIVSQLLLPFFVSIAAIIVVVAVHKTLLHLIMCFICHMALGGFSRALLTVHYVCAFFLCWLVQNLVVTYFGFSVAQIFSISILHSPRIFRKHKYHGC